MERGPVSRALTLLLTAAAVTGSLLAGVARAQTTPIARPANVLVITVDTLRPDALGWVAGRNATPAIDRLAREGFRFPAAVSPAPVTQPAHASLFTGLAPRRHGVRDNGQILGTRAATLATLLQEHGYATGAVVSGYPLAAEFGLDRGFDHYDAEFSAGTGGRLERPAAETTATALEWLGTVPEPWFLWVHYYDPHDPYEPPKVFERPGPRGSYHGEVAFVDHAIDELRQGQALRTSGKVLTIFTADHSESLGEHGEETHGFFLYESTIAVPLIVHYPGRVMPGESTAAVRLVDVAPTILDLLRLPVLEGIDGISLAELIRGADQTIPAAFVEARRPWLSYGWAPLEAVREGSWKLIAAPRPELYDLATDPNEMKNLVNEQRDVARRLSKSLREIKLLPAVNAATAVDPESLSRLQALGYVSAGSARGEPPRDAADPKDQLHLWNLLSEAVLLTEEGSHAEAIARFDAVLAQDPDNPFALSRSGAALLATNALSAAVPRLRRAVRLTPGDAETRQALAIALTRLGAEAEAAQEWMELARLQPRRVSAWVNLATSLGRGGKADEAVSALARAVDLVPERDDLKLRLAFAQHSLGKTEEASGLMLEVAEQVGPEAFRHAGSLGLLLLRGGRLEEAKRWLGRSQIGQGDYAEARFALSRLLAAGGESAQARHNLQLALSADPGLRARAEAEPTLAPLLP